MLSRLFSGVRNILYQVNSVVIQIIIILHYLLVLSFSSLCNQIMQNYTSQAVVESNADKTSTLKMIQIGGKNVKI